ncbi:SNF5-domain-containing protein [Patellaria atrata CBS 101060]|uniref:SNF5-domain-containing protein n=1 Tax=Patellaria atrata CBS 101060 TaxID=1346257 RepID=A0A9P4VVX3_9PEZI|nr:SNF5-domain-containing protein [Patellaria atrata CBS 101060]
MARKNPPQAFMSSYAPRLRLYQNSLLAPVIQPQNVIPQARTTKRGTTAINYAEDGYDDDFDDNVQGIWRDWMGKPKRALTESQLQIQPALPLTLIPIRIDLNIPSFRPEAPLPTPANAREFGINEDLTAYKQPEATPEFRLKDAFLWNLHEALLTPDQFAKTFVDELDFPNDRKVVLVMEIAKQIRTQLEEYAGVALHPFFDPDNNAVTDGPAAKPAGAALSRGESSTPMPTNGLTPAPTNGTKEVSPMPGVNSVTATAEPAAPHDILNPDDTYRCIINLTINLQNHLYNDKFEWSLLHPPGLAEHFAKVTCADLGLSGEWVVAMTHAIYEAVLRAKKDVFDQQSLLPGSGEVDNDAAEGAEAGWRYEPEHLADEWEPKVEILSKEEIEKREGDRERQIRRMRRETARFSSTANIAPQSDYFNQQVAEEQPMGRGERSKKKKRFRSLSPSGRDTPDTGFGGQGGGLQEWERQNWRCAHCKVWGSAVWAVRDGPSGARVSWDLLFWLCGICADFLMQTLCNNCGLLYERDKKLPPWNKDLYSHDRAFGTR